MHTKLENGVKVGNFVEIKKSTLGAGTKSMHLAYLGDATISADGRLLYVANLQNNLVHAIDLTSGDVTRKWPVGRRP